MFVPDKIGGLAVFVFLCFIKPILGNCYGPWACGGTTKTKTKDTASIEDIATLGYIDVLVVGETTGEKLFSPKIHASPTKM